MRIAHVALAVVDRTNTRGELFDERVHGLGVGGACVESRWIDELGDAGVERFAIEAGLLGGKRGETRIRCERAVGQGSQGLVGASHDGPEGFETRPSALDVVGVQEGAFPEALASNGIVRLSVDRQQQSAVLGRLRNPGHHHQHVAVGIGEDRSRPQSRACECHGIEVGFVVLQCCAGAARMHAVGEDA